MEREKIEKVASVRASERASVRASERASVRTSERTLGKAPLEISLLRALERMKRKVAVLLIFAMVMNSQGVVMAKGIFARFLEWQQKIVEMKDITNYRLTNTKTLLLGDGENTANAEIADETLDANVNTTDSAENESLNENIEDENTANGDTTENVADNDNSDNSNNNDINDNNVNENSNTSDNSLDNNNINENSDTNNNANINNNTNNNANNNLDDEITAPTYDEPIGPEYVEEPEEDESIEEHDDNGDDENVDNTNEQMYDEPIGPEYPEEPEEDEEIVSQVYDEPIGPEYIEENDIEENDEEANDIASTSEIDEEENENADNESEEESEVTDDIASSSEAESSYEANDENADIENIASDSDVTFDDADDDSNIASTSEIDDNANIASTSEIDDNANVASASEIDDNANIASDSDALLLGGVASLSNMMGLKLNLLGAGVTLPDDADSVYLEFIIPNDEQFVEAYRSKHIRIYDDGNTVDGVYLWNGTSWIIVQWVDLINPEWKANLVSYGTWGEFGWASPYWYPAPGGIVYSINDHKIQKDIWSYIHESVSRVPQYDTVNNFTLDYVNIYETSSSSGHWHFVGTHIKAMKHNDHGVVEYASNATFTLSFDGGGFGFGQLPPTQNILVEDSSSKTSAPLTTLNSYNATFDYWYDSTTDGTIPFTFGTHIDHDITLKAHWTPTTWTITYDLGTGASWNAANPFTVVNSRISTISVALPPKEKVVAPAGKVFDHWEVVGTKTGTAYHCKDNTTLTTIAAIGEGADDDTEFYRQNLKIKAVYKDLKTVTYVYDAYGATNVVWKTTTSVVGTKTTHPGYPTVAETPGITWSGWRVPGATTNFDFTNTVINNDITLKAYADPTTGYSSFTITYDFGGKGGFVSGYTATTSRKANSDFTLPPKEKVTVNTANKYLTFDSWYYNATFATPCEISGTNQIIKNKKENAKNLTIYAKFKTDIFSIILDKNHTDDATDHPFTNPANIWLRLSDKKWASADTFATANLYTSTNKVPIPTRHGYTFKGYYNNATFTTQIIKETGEPIVDATTLTNLSTLEVSGNITLYAKWEAKAKTTIILNNADGAETGITANQTFYSVKDTGIFKSADFKMSEIVDATHPIATPTHPKKIFGGYGSTSGGGGTKYIEASGYPTTNFVSTNFTTNKTIYAKWTNIKQVINLDYKKNGVDPDNVSSLTSYSKVYAKYGYGLYRDNALSAVFDTSHAITKPAFQGYTFKGYFDGTTKLIDENGKPTTAFTNTYFDRSIVDTVITAEYEVNDYTVTYHTNCSVNLPQEQRTYSMPFDLPDNTLLTKTGYTFGGYYLNSIFAGVATTSIPAFTQPQNIDVYVKWNENEYNITLHDNGGIYVSGYTKPTSRKYTESKTLPTNANITKTGYTFAGWYDNSTFTGTAVTSIPVNTNSDKEYWLKWNENNYTITYHENGGTYVSGYTKPTSRKYTEGKTLPTNANITKTGYTFAGWYDNATFQGVATTSVPANTVGNKEVWLKWDENEYNITYNFSATQRRGGAFVSGYDPVADGKTKRKYTEEEILPTAEKLVGEDSHSKFLGWWTDSAFTEGNGPILKVNANTTSDKTFYANFDYYYDVTFDMGGHGTEHIPATQNIRHGKLATKPNADPYDPLWTFGGYYKENTYTNAWNFNTDQVTSDTTIYVKWNELSIVVDYDLGGGHYIDPALNSLSVTWDVNNENITLPSYTNIEKSNYHFIGFTYMETGDTPLITELKTTDFVSTYLSHVVLGHLKLRAIYRTYSDERNMFNINPSGVGQVHIKLYHKNAAGEYLDTNTGLDFNLLVFNTKNPIYQYGLITNSVPPMGSTYRVSSISQILSMPININGYTTTLKNINQNGIRYSLDNTFTNMKFLSSNLDITSLNNEIKTDILNEIGNSNDVTLYVSDEVLVGDNPLIPIGAPVPPVLTDYRLLNEVSYLYDDYNVTPMVKSPIKQAYYVPYGATLSEADKPTVSDENVVIDKMTNNKMVIQFYSEKETEDNTGVAFNYQNKVITKDIKLYPHRFIIGVDFILYNASETIDKRGSFVNEWKDNIPSGLISRNAGSATDPYNEFYWMGPTVTLPAQDMVTKFNNVLKGFSYDDPDLVPNPSLVTTFDMADTSYISHINLMTNKMTLYAVYEQYNSSNSTKILDGNIKIHLKDGDKDTDIDGVMEVDLYKTTIGTEYHFLKVKPTMAGVEPPELRVDNLLSKELTNRGTTFTLKSINNGLTNTNKLTFTHEATTSILVVEKTQEFSEWHEKLKYVVRDIKNTGVSNIYVDAQGATFLKKALFYYNTTNLVNTIYRLQGSKINFSDTNEVPLVFIDLDGKTYQVSGWSSINTAGASAVTGEVTMNSDRNFYAQNATLASYEFIYDPRGGKWADGTSTNKTAYILLRPDNTVNLKGYDNASEITKENSVLKGWSLVGEANPISNNVDITDLITYITGKGYPIGTPVPVYAMWENLNGIDEGVPENDPSSNYSLLSEGALKINLMHNNVATGLTGDVQVRLYETNIGVSTYSFIKIKDSAGNVGAVISKVEDILQKEFTNNGTIWKLSYINNKYLKYKNSSNVNFAAPATNSIATYNINVLDIINGIKLTGSSSAYNIYVEDIVAHDHENTANPTTDGKNEEGKPLYHKVTFETANLITYSSTSYIRRGLKIGNIRKQQQEFAINNLDNDKIVTEWKEQGVATAFDFENTEILSDKIICAIVSAGGYRIIYDADGGVFSNGSSLQEEIIAREAVTDKVLFKAYYAANEISKADKVFAGWHFEGETDIIPQNTVYTDFINEAINKNKLINNKIKLIAKWENLIGPDEGVAEDDPTSNYSIKASDVNLKVNLTHSGVETGVNTIFTAKVYETKTGFATYSFIKIKNTSGVYETTQTKVEEILQREFTSDGLVWKFSYIDNKKLTYKGNTATTYVALATMSITSSNNGTRNIIDGLKGAGNSGTYNIYVSDVVSHDHDNTLNPSTDGKNDEGQPLYHKVTFDAVGILPITYSSSSYIRRGLKISNAKKHAIEAELNIMYNDISVSSFRELGASVDFDFENTEILGDKTIKAYYLDGYKLVYDNEGGKWSDGSTSVKEEYTTKDASGKIVIKNYGLDVELSKDNYVFKGWHFSNGMSPIVKDITYSDFIHFVLNNNLVETGNKIKLYAIWEALNGVDEGVPEIDPSSNYSVKATDVHLKINLTHNNVDTGVNGKVVAKVYETKTGFATYSFIKIKNTSGTYATSITKVEDILQREFTSDGTIWKLSYIDNKHLTYKGSGTSTYVALSTMSVTTNNDETKNIVNGLKGVGSNGTYNIYVADIISANHDNTANPDTEGTNETGHSMYDEVTWNAAITPAYSTVSYIRHGLKITSAKRTSIENAACLIDSSKTIVDWKKQGETTSFNFDTKIMGNITLNAEVVSGYVVKYHLEGGKWTDGTTDDKMEGIVEDPVSHKVVFKNYTSLDAIKDGKVFKGWKLAGMSTVIDKDKLYNDFISEATLHGHIVNNKVDVCAEWGDLIGPDEGVAENDPNSTYKILASDVHLKINLTHSNVDTGVNGQVVAKVYETKTGYATYSYIKIKNALGVYETNITEIDEILQREFSSGGNIWKLSYLDNKRLTYKGSGASTYVARSTDSVISYNLNTSNIVLGLKGAGSNGTYSIYVEDQVSSEHDNPASPEPPIDPTHSLLDKIEWKATTPVYASVSYVLHNHKIDINIKTLVENEINQIDPDKTVSKWIKQGEVNEFDFANTLVTDNITLVATVISGYILVYHPEGGKFSDGTTVEKMESIVEDASGKIVLKGYTAGDGIVKDEKVFKGWHLSGETVVIPANRLYADFVTEVQTKHLVHSNKIDVYATWDNLLGPDEGVPEGDPSSNYKVLATDVNLKVNLTHSGVLTSKYANFVAKVYETKGISTYSYIKVRDISGTYLSSITKIDDILQREFSDNGNIWKLAYLNNKHLTYKGNTATTYVTLSTESVVSYNLNTNNIVNGLKGAGTNGTYNIYVEDVVESDHDNPSNPSDPPIDTGHPIYHKVVWNASLTPAFSSVSYVRRNRAISNNERVKVELEVNMQDNSKTISSWQKSGVTYDFTTLVTDDMVLNAVLVNGGYIIKYYPEGGTWYDGTTVMKEESLTKNAGTNTVALRGYSNLTDITNGDKVFMGWHLRGETSVVPNERLYSDLLFEVYTKGLFVETNKIELYGVWKDKKGQDEGVPESSDDSTYKIDGTDIKLSVNLVKSVAGVNSEEGIKGTVLVKLYTSKGAYPYSYIKIKNASGTYGSQESIVDELLKREFLGTDGNKWKLSYIDNTKLTYGKVLTNVNNYVATKDTKIVSYNTSVAEIINVVKEVVTNNAVSEGKIYVLDKVTSTHDDTANPDTEGTNVPGQGVYSEVTWKSTSPVYNVVKSVRTGKKIPISMKNEIENAIMNLGSNKYVSMWKKLGETSAYDFNTRVVDSSMTLNATVLTMNIVIRYNVLSGKWQDNDGQEVREVALHNVSNKPNLLVYTDNTKVTIYSAIFEGWSFTNGGGIISKNMAYNNFVIDCVTNNRIGADGKVDLYARYKHIEGTSYFGGLSRGGGGAGGGGGGVRSGLPVQKMSSTDVAFKYDEVANSWYLINKSTGERVKGVVDIAVEINKNRVEEIYNDANIGLTYTKDQAVNQILQPVDFVKDSELYKAVTNNLDKDYDMANIQAYATTEELVTHDNPADKQELILTYCFDDITGNMYEGWRMYNGEWYYFLDARKYGYLLKEVEYKKGNLSFIFDRNGRCKNMYDIPMNWKHDTNLDVYEIEREDGRTYKYDYKKGTLYAYRKGLDGNLVKDTGMIFIDDKVLYFDPTKDGACYVGGLDTFFFGNVDISAINAALNNQFAMNLMHKDLERENILAGGNKDESKSAIYQFVMMIKEKIKSIFDMNKQVIDDNTLNVIAVVEAEKLLKGNNANDSSRRDFVATLVNREPNEAKDTPHWETDLSQGVEIYYIFNHPALIKDTVENKTYGFSVMGDNIGERLIGEVEVGGVKSYFDPNTYELVEDQSKWPTNTANATNLVSTNTTNAVVNTAVADTVTNTSNVINTSNIAETAETAETTVVNENNGITGRNDFIGTLATLEPKTDKGTVHWEYDPEKGVNVYFIFDHPALIEDKVYNKTYAFGVLPENLGKRLTGEVDVGGVIKHFSETTYEMID